MAVIKQWNPIKIFSDGKYNWETDSEIKYLPGYVDDPEHPFTVCTSLTHVDPITSTPNKNFCMGDDPDLFQKNLKKMPNDWKYRYKNIEYNVNNSGYRTKEWKNIDWSNSIVIFGCSCTYGVGLNEDETISYHLEKLLGRPVINMGFPSGSNNLILNNIVTCFEKFGSPYGVVANWTTTDRFRYYSKDIFHEIGPWNDPFSNEPDIINHVNLSDLWVQSFYDSYNENATNYYLGKTAKIICEPRTKYTSISYFSQTAHVMRADNFFVIKTRNKARDLIHPGEDNSIEVANYLANKFK